MIFGLLISSQRYLRYIQVYRYMIIMSSYWVHLSLNYVLYLCKCFFLKFFFVCLDGHLLFTSHIFFYIFIFSLYICCYILGISLKATPTVPYKLSLRLLYQHLAIFILFLVSCLGSPAFSLYQSYLKTRVESSHKLRIVRLFGVVLK